MNEISSRAKKNLGRRKSGTNTRSILLKAATELILENGMQPISVRDISLKADVNQAMVHYHFDDKEGLMKAVLNFGFEQLLEQVPADASFEKTIYALISWTQANAWLLILMMQSVYAGDNLRNHFETEHAPRLAGLYQSALENGRKSGLVRDDLDPKFAMSALISLVVFPNLAGPSLGRVLGVKRGKNAAKQYTTELLKLFNPKGE